MKHIIASLFLMLAASPVCAQSWTSDLKKDDFGDKDVGVAIVFSEGRGFGLRCVKGQPPTFVFATRERWGEGLELLPATILVRVDDRQAVSLVADLESYDGTNAFRSANLVRATTTDPQVMKVAEEIKSAKLRIAVAIEVAGQRFEATQFAAKGSSGALDKIAQLCSG